MEGYVRYWIYKALKSKVYVLHKTISAELMKLWHGLGWHFDLVHTIMWVKYSKPDTLQTFLLVSAVREISINLLKVNMHCSFRSHFFPNQAIAPSGWACPEPLFLPIFFRSLCTANITNELGYSRELNLRWTFREIEYEHRRFYEKRKKKSYVSVFHPDPTTSCIRLFRMLHNGKIRRAVPLSSLRTPLPLVPTEFNVQPVQQGLVVVVGVWIVGELSRVCFFFPCCPFISISLCICCTWGTFTQRCTVILVF